jgi:predicted NBD/HSP70 family sugar kinase
MRVLVVDIGGNNVKVAVPGRHNAVKVPSGPALTARRMLSSVRRAITGWDYDVVSVGYPGVVVNGVPAEEPVNLGRGWVGFDFEGAFGRPVRFINDAAMQALGSYEGGRMLFLGLGTGLGTALVVDGMVLPLEVAHLPYRKGHSYEDHVGRAGLDRYGRKRWREFVAEVTGLLKHALQADYVVLGGGNVKELRELPAGARAGANANALLGGVRLWEAPAWAEAAVHPVKGSTPGKRTRERPRRAGGASGTTATRAHSPNRSATAAGRVAPATPATRGVPRRTVRG